MGLYFRVGKFLHLGTIHETSIPEFRGGGRRLFIDYVGADPGRRARGGGYHMVAVSQRERDALAAVLEADDAERHRATWWGIVSREDKCRALMVANLDKRRAADELGTFTPEERVNIVLALTAHQTKMQLVAAIFGGGIGGLGLGGIARQLHHSDLKH